MQPAKPAVAQPSRFSFCALAAAGLPAIATGEAGMTAAMQMAAKAFAQTMAATTPQDHTRSGAGVIEQIQRAGSGS